MVKQYQDVQNLCCYLFQTHSLTSAFLYMYGMHKTFFSKFLLEIQLLNDETSEIQFRHLQGEEIWKKMDTSKIFHTVVLKINWSLYKNSELDFVVSVGWKSKLQQKVNMNQSVWSVECEHDLSQKLQVL